MAAIFGPGGPIILPWTVRGDRFSGGTVHGVTLPHTGLCDTLATTATHQQHSVNYIVMEGMQPTNQMVIFVQSNHIMHTSRTWSL